MGPLRRKGLTPQDRLFMRPLLTQAGRGLREVAALSVKSKGTRTMA